MEDGSIVNDRAPKAGLLWAAFKDRLGQSECQSFLFDLDTFVESVQLPVLDSPFTKEEIYLAVKNMP